MGKKKYDKDKSKENKNKNDDKSEIDGDYYRRSFDEIAKQILDSIAIGPIPSNEQDPLNAEEIIDGEKPIDSQQKQVPTYDECAQSKLTKIRQNLQNINLIREELCKLSFNIEGRIYYEQEVFPLLNTLSLLSFAVERYALSAENLSTIPLTRSADICDLIQLTYRTADLSEEVLRILEVKVKRLIKISKKKR